MLVQGNKRGKVKKKVKMVLPVDFKFKDGPSEEEEPGGINHRSAQASPCFSMIGFRVIGFSLLRVGCTLQHPQKDIGSGYPESCAL